MYGAGNTGNKREGIRDKKSYREVSESDVYLAEASGDGRGANAGNARLSMRHVSSMAPYQQSET